MARKLDLGTKYLSPTELKELNLASKDIFFFSLFIYVINPVEGRVKFGLYPYQKSVVYQFLKERFNIILKFRQAGITELISMYCLWLAMYHPNKKINIISIKDTVAKKVLKKIKFMYKNLPLHLRTPIINGRSGEFGSSTMIEFSNGSFIESIPTSEDAGRSESLTLLVIDEAAIVRWAASIWAAALPTLSTGGAAIVNSCITGDTEIIGSNGPFRVDSIAPKQFGKHSVEHLGLKVLTHTGEWEKVLGAVNKGYLETWEIENDRGDILKCTPKHKLLTHNGWKTVEEIISNDLPAIFYDAGQDVENNPVTKKPNKEIYQQVNGYPNYVVSNWGNLYIKDKKGNLIQKHSQSSGRNGKGQYKSVTLWKNGKKKKISIHNLVAQTFIGEISEGYVVDHINNNPSDNYVSNLQIITLSENSKRATRFSKSYQLGCRLNSNGFTYPLEAIAYLKYLYSKEVPYYGFIKKITDKVNHKFNINLTKEYASRICSGDRQPNIFISKLKVNRKFSDLIYDICVEKNESYIVTSKYVSHNTPYGVGNFYHATWVDALTGGNDFNPIRLFWQMHPDREQDWYDTMAANLGPRRTAQEIDGDFLSSGNSVFDLTDIKAIEDMFSEYPVLKTRFNGKYREYLEPDKNSEYFIGADCSTGRASDYSAFTVMDHPGEEHACFKGRIALDKFGKFLGDIGEYYNYACLAPETNDVGMAVTSHLQSEGYPNLYYTKKILRKRKKHRPETEDIPGWLTTTKNRSLIIENLETDIREDNIIVKDPFFTQEAYTFIYDGAGRPVAMGKSNSKNSSVDIDLEGTTYADDSIFGKAITNHIRKNHERRISVLPQ